MSKFDSVSEGVRHFFPSIWRGAFRSQADYVAAAPALGPTFGVLDAIDDRELRSRHPFVTRAWCASCMQVTDMHLDWGFAGSVNGSVHLAWTETGACSQCRLNSRMRAVIDFLQTQGLTGKSRRVYVAEQTTHSYKVLRSMYPGIVGSEYLGPEHRRIDLLKRGIFGKVRHEDLTALSFSDSSFDLVITQDVFEHIPDYRKSFAQIHRVLDAGGWLVFTIPFFADFPTTRVRASIGTNGEVVHHLPPEIHGNPVSNEGALCFQNFGWDLLDDLREAGFSDAVGSMYWGPWQGHLGFPFFVFHARKA